LCALASDLTASVSRGTAFARFEFASLPRNAARAALDAPELAPHRHALAKDLALAPYLVSPGEQAALDALEITAKAELAAAWQRASAEVRVGAGACGLSQALARLNAPNRRTRGRALARLAAALAPRRDDFARRHAELLALEARAGAARGLPHRLAMADIEQECPVPVRQAALAAMRRGFTLCSRYHRLKARLMGLSRLTSADRFAPVPHLPGFSYGRAATLAERALTGLSPACGAIARAISESRRIDAAIRPGKQAGAFCLTPPGSSLAFIHVNFAGTWRDAAVLAHELGHGVQQTLSSPLGARSRESAPILAEAVAFTAELALFELALGRARSPRVRLALLCARIEDELTSGPRQAALFGFEQAVREVYKATGTLTADDLDAAWLASLRGLYQDSLELRGEDTPLWMAAAHPVVIPGYVRHYPVALCLARGLWRARAAGPARFAAAFEAVLACGSSQPAAELAGLFGLDLDDPELYHAAMNDLEKLIEQAEAAAGE
jgi:oligoendopeptidase F